MGKLNVQYERGKFEPIHHMYSVMITHLACLGGCGFRHFQWPNTQGK